MLICLNGGLGNQIGNYIFAQFLMEKGIECKIIASNNVGDYREVVIHKLGVELDIAEHFDIERFIKLKTSPLLLFNLFTKNIFDKIWRNNLWNFLKRISSRYNIYPKKTPSFLSKLVTHKDVLKYGLKDGAICDCYSPIEEFNDEDFKNKMRGILFSRESELLADSKNASVLEKIKSVKNPVGIHIRRGDFINFKIPVVKSEFILDKMKYMNESLDGVRFFIFSNGMDWVKENIKGFNNIDFVDVNDEETGYLDFLLFDKCKHRIYSNSTFSLWIRYFNPYRKGFKNDEASSIEFYPKRSDMQLESVQNTEGSGL